MSESPGPGVRLATIRALVYPDCMFGFFNIYKPAGPTSHDVVVGVRRLLRGISSRASRRGPKVGHAGTLDPFAEGVLVLCVGRATRLAEYVQRSHKRYDAEVILGAMSTTDDSLGRITESPVTEAPCERRIRRACERFVGRIEQAPPAHSAVHVNGRRAYELARAGRRIELPPRPVVIHRIEVISYAFPRLRLDVTCGSGTYIRALARDIGHALGVGGYCSALRRTEVGPYRIGEAIPVEKLDPRRDILDPLTALEALGRLTVGEAQRQRLAVGNTVELAESVPAGELAVVDTQGRLIAIARADEAGPPVGRHVGEIQECHGRTSYLTPTRVFLLRPPRCPGEVNS